MGQVVSATDYQEIKKKQLAGQKVVFTNGCFDLLHVGHVRYLQEAKAQGDVLVVGLNSDASVKRLKGKERPIQKEQDRAEILAALGAVDYVIVFSEDTPLKLIKMVEPSVLVKGGDWALEQIVGADFVLGYGGEVKSLKFVDGHSTTAIVTQLKNTSY